MWGDEVLNLMITSKSRQRPAVPSWTRPHTGGTGSVLQIIHLTGLMDFTCLNEIL